MTTAAQYAEQIRKSQRRTTLLVSLLVFNGLLLAVVCGAQVWGAKSEPDAAKVMAPATDQAAILAEEPGAGLVAAPATPNEPNIVESEPTVLLPQTSEQVANVGENREPELSSPTSVEPPVDAPPPETQTADSTPNLQDLEALWSALLPPIQDQMRIVRGRMVAMAEQCQQRKTIANLPPALVIENPATMRGVVHFLIEREPKSLQPGEQYRAAGAGPWQIQFHRGGDFEDVDLQAHPGHYRFHVDVQGWSLRTGEK